MDKSEKLKEIVKQKEDLIKEIKELSSFISDYESINIPNNLYNRQICIIPTDSKYYTYFKNFIDKKSIYFDGCKEKAPIYIGLDGVRANKIIGWIIEGSNTFLRPHKERLKSLLPEYEITENFAYNDDYTDKIIKELKYENNKLKEELSLHKFESDGTIDTPIEDILNKKIVNLEKYIEDLSGLIQDKDKELYQLKNNTFIERLKKLF